MVSQPFTQLLNNHMKKIVAILGLCLFSSQVNAQIFSGESIINQENIDNKRWSWGYYLGFNTYDFDFDLKKFEPQKPFQDKGYNVEQTIGFNVGLVGSLKLNHNFDLRLEPGVSFNTRNFQLLKADQNTFREINATYVHIPLLIKFSADRLNNFRPFVLAGASTSINLSSNENNPDDNSVGQFRMKTNTFYYEVGVGLDLYLPYFKFSPSLRGIFAINDELVRDEDPNSIFTGNVEQMRTRGVFLNFTFQ